jgi:hypothetical protein
VFYALFFFSKYSKWKEEIAVCLDPLHNIFVTHCRCRPKDMVIFRELQSSRMYRAYIASSRTQIAKNLKVGVYLELQKLWCHSVIRYNIDVN